MSKIKVLVVPSDRTGVGKFRSVDPHVFLQNLYGNDFHVDIIYEPSYESFVSDRAEHGMELVDFDQFKKIVHEYKDEELRLKMRPYAELVVSNPDVIDMFDPSGGPYLHEGQDMREFFYKFDFKEPLIIKEFKTSKDDYVLILLK